MMRYCSQCSFKFLLPHSITAIMLPQIHITPSKEKSTMLMNVQRFDKLVPIIGGALRETKSTGPMNAMMKLSINAKLLVLEVAAVRVQSLYRQYMAKKRVKLIKHHVKLFLEITSDFCDRVVEEVVLASSFEISLGLFKSHRRYQLLKALVETEMIEIIEDLIMEEVSDKSREVVVEIISEVTKYFDSKKPRRPEVQKYNLLLALITDISNEAADTFMRAVAVEAVQEEVKEYLLTTYSNFLFEWLCNDVVFEFTKPALVDAILAEGFYDKRNFNVVNMIDILRTSTENNTDSIYFPLHCFHQDQLRHGINHQNKVMEVTQLEMDKAITSMEFLSFINDKLRTEAQKSAVALVEEISTDFSEDLEK